MKRKTIWVLLTCLMVLSLVLASCAKSTTTSTTPSTASNTATSTITSTSTTSTSSTLTTTATTAAVTTTVTSTGNWWDYLGIPTYGGTLVEAISSDITSWDTYYGTSGTGIYGAWEQRLQTTSWTLDPSIFNYNTDFIPDEYMAGQLATSWEFTDPNTLVYHLRQGIHWQNIPPVNGREFTSADIVAHYGRMFGLGINSKPSPIVSAITAYASLKSITASDKYTVAFTWSGVSEEYILEQMDQAGTEHCIEAPDAVAQWGDLTDWHHAIGTGPFILTDFVSGSSATLVRNPTYWEYDERYPQNQLPYIDQLKVIIVPNTNTVLAAFRTGKVDFSPGLTYDQYKGLQQTNPEMIQQTGAGGNLTMDPRDNVAPFNDIRVREALQEAIDMKTIGATLFNGYAHTDPTSITSYLMTGWGYPYKDWSQDLKDMYAYNPAKAKANLAAAGYPNGLTTSLIVDSTSNMDLLLVVESELAAVGIKTSAQVMDDASWQNYMRGGSLTTIGFSTTQFMGISFVPSRQLILFQTGYRNNWCGISDPVYDNLVAQGLVATTTDQVKQILYQVNVYVAQHLWKISLPASDAFSEYQPWLKGYTGKALTSGARMGPSGTAAHWWIDLDLKKSLGH